MCFDSSYLLSWQNVWRSNKNCRQQRHFVSTERMARWHKHRGQDMNSIVRPTDFHAGEMPYKTTWEWTLTGVSVLQWSAVVSQRRTCATGRQHAQHRISKYWMLPALQLDGLTSLSVKLSPLQKMSAVNWRIMQMHVTPITSNTGLCTRRPENLFLTLLNITFIWCRC